MDRLSKFFMVFLFAIFCMGISSIAEEVTLTTYYPAPYGAYEELSVKDGAVIGANYAGTETAPANGMLIEGNVGIGTITATQALNVNGTINATGFSADGTAGVATYTMSIRATDGGIYTVVVTDGIITSITKT